jgi:chaperonin cofactor prefoldin
MVKNKMITEELLPSLTTDIEFLNNKIKLLERTIDFLTSKYINLSETVYKLEDVMR